MWLTAWWPASDLCGWNHTRSSPDPYHKPVNLQNLSLWEASRVLYKEFQRSRVLSFIVQQDQVNYHQKIFLQIVLCLSMTQINYSESESWCLNRHWLLSLVDFNCLLALPRPYSAGGSGPRDLPPHPLTPSRVVVCAWSIPERSESSTSWVVYSTWMRDVCPSTLPRLAERNLGRAHNALPPLPRDLSN